MTGQQLKNSILQMAVQGKLVPQDPNDEPASVLLERIRAEKEQLIKEGKIKKEKNPSVIFRGADNLPYEKIGKNEPVCIAEEVPFDIPESWEWVTLKMIAVTELGKTLDKAKNQGDCKPYLCSINVYWSGIDLTTVKEARFEESELPKYKLKKGDLLICEGGDVGRSAIWENEQEMYYQNALHRVRFYGGVNPHYFRLLMECYKGNKILDEQSKGMTIKHLVQSALNTIYFPLPPIQEQQRIVDKFQSLIPMLEQYNASEIKLSNLNTGFSNLLKKSILQEAVQGKLVPQDPADEPASVLLERIRAEKEQLIKAGKIKRDKHESVIFRRDNSYYEKVDGIERCIDDELPFEIPESWGWCRLKSLTENITSGSRDWAKYYSTTGAAFLRMGNLSKNSFDLRLEHIQRVTIPSKAEGTRTSLQSGDLLFSITGDVGMLGLIPDGFEKAYINQHTAMIRFLPEMRNKYIPYLLLTDYAQKFYNANQHGIKNSFRLDSIGELLVSIPPEKELFRILQRISLVLSKIAVL